MYTRPMDPTPQGWPPSRVQLPPAAPHFPRGATLRQPRRLRWPPRGWQVAR